MKRSWPRTRKTVKWGGAVVSVVLVVVWIVSMRVCVLWVWFGPKAGLFADTLPYLSLLVGGGRVSLEGDDWQSVSYGSAARSTTWSHRSGDVFPWFRFERPGRQWEHFALSIPLWSLALPAILLTAWAWRLDLIARRRANTGKCLKCGYDLKGLPAAATTCPECGPAAALPIV